METAIQLSSAAATVEGPLEGETGHGLLHLPEVQIFALAAGADGRPSDSFSVRILTKALRIAFRPKDGVQMPATLAEKSQFVRNAIRAAGEAIATQPSEKRTGGATLVVVAFDPAQPENVLVLNVGDCRCYRFRNSRPECLTRTVAATGGAEETPLLMDVLTSSIGGDEPPEIEEQTLKVENGDVFVLVPGALFRAKTDLAVGRALRRVPGKPADAMAASVVEEALKTESAAGISLVVKADIVGGGKAASAVAANDEEPAEESAKLENISDEPAAESEPAEEADAEKSAAPETPAEHPSEKQAEPDADKNAEASSDAVAETPAVVVAKEEAKEAKPARQRRTPRKVITDDPAELPVDAAPVAPVPEPEQPVPAPAATPAAAAENVSRQAVLAAAASVPPKSAQPQRGLGPLTRKPLLHAEKPEDRHRIRVPWDRIITVVIVLAVLGGAGWGVTKLVKKIIARSSGGTELEQGAAAAGIVARAQLTGAWGGVEQKLAKLPPLASGDEDLTRAWIALWNSVNAADFAEAPMRARLEMAGALVVQAGGPAPAPLAVWTPANRADEICRALGARQRALHGAIEAALASANRRGDFAFADRTEQNEALAGFGRFSRTRLNTKLAAIAGDFAFARTAEGQLESAINLHRFDLPVDDASLQRFAGEPLRQLNTSLDRAWDGLLDVIAQSATDSAQWKRTASAALAPRLNRLDAVRQNVLAERKKFGDVRRWRTGTPNKQLVIWLLNETASLGVALNPPPAPPAAPASSTRRR